MSQTTINYAAGFDTPLGRMILLAEDISTENKKVTSIQLIGLGFASIKMNDEAVIAGLTRQLGCQNVFPSPDKLWPFAIKIFDQPHKVPVSLRGTDFQKKVWRRLMEIPTGTAASYGKISDNLQSAPRAVGTAVGKNPVSLLALVTGLSVLQAICMVIDGGRVFKNPYSRPRVRPFQLRFKIIGH